MTDLRLKWFDYTIRLLSLRPVIIVVEVKLDFFPVFKQHIGFDEALPRHAFWVHFDATILGARVLRWDRILLLLPRLIVLE